MMMLLRLGCRRRNRKGGDNDIFSMGIIRIHSRFIGYRHLYFMNIRSDRKMYLLPPRTAEPSCNKHSLPWLGDRGNIFGNAMRI